MHTDLLGSIGHVQSIFKLLLEKSLKKGDRVADCTLGNGGDALLLLECVGAQGYLYGFDIQDEAIENSRRKLEAAGFENFTLIKDSHAHLSAHLPCGISGFVFNLGYLPKGDKQLTTRWESTQQALMAAMALVKPSGFIAVTTYPGHAQGQVEDEQLQVWLSSLDQKLYQVANIQFINQQNSPPKLYWLTRRP